MHITIQQDNSESHLLFRDHNQLPLTYVLPFKPDDIDEIKLLANCYQMLHMSISDLTNNQISTRNANSLKRLFVALIDCPYLISVEIDLTAITLPHRYSQQIFNQFKKNIEKINKKVGEQTIEREELMSNCLQQARYHYSNNRTGSALVFYALAVILNCNHIEHHITVDDLSLLYAMAKHYQEYDNNLDAMQCYAFILKITPDDEYPLSHYQHVSTLFCKNEKHTFKSKNHTSFKLISSHKLKSDEESTPIKGGFSSVSIGLFKNKPIIIKKLNSSSEKIKDWKKFKNEYEIHGSLKHSHIVKLIGICIEVDAYCFIQERIMNGTLRQYVYENALSFTEWWLIVRDIASALEYIHQQGIVHNDIQPENILLTETNRAMLTDFGIATPQNACHSAGTTHFLAPELFNPASQPYKNIHTEATDIYSFGMVMWFMFTRKIPFSGEHNSFIDTIKRLKEGHREEMPTLIPESMENIIKTCWQKNALLRPSSSELKKTATSEYSALTDRTIELLPDDEIKTPPSYLNCSIS